MKISTMTHSGSKNIHLKAEVITNIIRTTIITIIRSFQSTSKSSILKASIIRPMNLIPINKNTIKNTIISPILLQKVSLTTNKLIKTKWSFKKELLFNLV